LQAITNLNELPGRLKKALFSLRKAAKLSSFASVIRTWQLKRINRDVEKILGRVTTVTRQKTSSVPDTGLVKLGEDAMKVEEVLAKLEKHEAECNLRYKNIEQRLDDQKETLKGLDYKIWGLAVLIIIAPFVQKFLG
jgi:hypothetical protein